MRALILGGTAFVGRHIAEAFLSNGHHVTLFHRGRSNPSVLSGCEHILGDRNGDLSELGTPRWDVVVDTSGYEVPTVRASATFIAGSEARYVFVSTISVYADPTRNDEAAPVMTAHDADRASLSFANYGALKAACEREIQALLPERAQIIRAGIILGPHDYDERFPYLLSRIARGGQVLAPGEPSAFVQFIDVRDLAAWIVKSVEGGATGVFNATGPGEAATMQGLLETIRDATKSDARFTWVADEVLLELDVKPYSEMPFWLPQKLGYVPVNASRARSAGLRHRPIIDTVRDTWTWLQACGDEPTRLRAHRRLALRGGISAERERTILEKAGLREPS